MEDSILISVKKILGIDEADTAFDLDILIHINSVFSTLHQLGVGPEDGFFIEDDAALWSTYIGGNNQYNFVKTYMYLSVRLLFDPPQTSYLIESLNAQKKEIEWRLNAVREETLWVDPTILEDEEELVLDGGEP